MARAFAYRQAMQNDLKTLAERLEHLSASFGRMGVRSCHDCGLGQTGHGRAGTQPPGATNDCPGDERGAGIPDPRVVGFGGARPVAAQAEGLAFVKAVMRSRQRRSSFLDGDLLFDPAWAMLLDLYCATLQGKRLSVTALTIGSGVPDTTALRYLRLLEERGHVARVPDDSDRRRSFVKLTSTTFAGMSAYFAALEADTLAILPPRTAYS